MDRGKQFLIALPLVLAGVLGFVLPSVGNGLLMSPDETAAYVSLSRMGDWQPAAIAEPLAEDFPWLHPRSFVSRGQYIVPVGFLGWPWLLSFFTVFGDRLAPGIGTLLILSSAYPLYRLLTAFGRRGAFWGTFVYLTFPPFILYANRSLFANGALLAGFLWSLFFLKSLGAAEWKGRKWHAGLLGAGLLLGLTAAVRPVEMLWMLPWFFWAGQGLGLKKKHGIWFLGGLLLVMLPLMLQALLTYGSPAISGYQVADNPPPYEVRADAPAVAEGEWLDRFLPYGFHPRNAIWNVRSFLFGYLWAWMIPLAAFLVFYVRRIERPKKPRDLLHPLWLSLWTALVILVIYGSGKYLDHVEVGAVTIGNSFLRYALPLAPLLAVAVAYLWRLVEGRRLHMILLAALTLLLGGFGVQKAFTGDDESLLAARPELSRYEDVRAAAHEWFGAKDVIISERSDKIFFPEFRAVSPMPPASEIGRLANTGELKVGLYVRPLSQKEKDAWKRYGLDVIELGSFAREKLYLLKPAP